MRLAALILAPLFFLSSTGWQTDFEKAKQSFDTYYNGLNKVSFRFANQSCNLSGVYEQPTEEKKFSSAVFSITPAEAEIRQLKVELLMEYNITEWKVKFLVYDKEREDDEQGEIKAN